MIYGSTWNLLELPYQSVYLQQTLYSVEMKTKIKKSRTYYQCKDSITYKISSQKICIS